MVEITVEQRREDAGASSHGCATREYNVRKDRLDHGTEQLDEIARVDGSIAYQHGIQARHTTFSLIRAEFVEQRYLK